jgi:hypothetical protein
MVRESWLRAFYQVHRQQEDSMHAFLNWWYTVSLPHRGPDVTPAQRERTRYARLTTNFTLLLLILTVALTPLSIFNAYNPAAPIIALIGLGLVVAAVLFNKLGLNILAAIMIVSSTTFNVMGTMITNALDPSLVPIFGALVIPVILSGSLMPPVAALIDGMVNVVLILLVDLFQHHTRAYDDMMRLGLYSVSAALPITLQIVVAVVTYVIMRNLILTIRRADRAEEIIELQKTIAEFERTNSQERKQLEEGLTLISQVHTDIARGNFDIRVPFENESVLWPVVVSLNNLLHSIRQWKGDAEQLERLRQVIGLVVQEIQKARVMRRPAFFQRRTGTLIDPLLAEINQISAQAFHSSQSQPPR